MRFRNRCFRLPRKCAGLSDTVVTKAPPFCGRLAIALGVTAHTLLRPRHCPGFSGSEIASLDTNARDNFCVLICKQRAAPPCSNLCQEISSILRQQDTKCFHPIFLSQRHQIGPERRKSTIRGNLHTFNPGTQFLSPRSADQRREMLLGDTRVRERSIARCFIPDNPDPASLYEAVARI